MADLHYTLKSRCCGESFEDNSWALACPKDEKPAMIYALYKKEHIDVGDPSEGLYRFADWLPICRRLVGSAAPVTYKSEGLAKRLGLQNLYITFSGYWPEKGAHMQTGTFKECEAYSVCARYTPYKDKILVVASAGNTARAFAHVCSANKIPLLISVPEDNLDALWSDTPLDDCVKLVCTPSGSDYYDAIALSDIACAMDEFYPEGGAKNVARRDGMSTTVLSATTTIGYIPDFYFQAVGSGTGAIAAWEANERLLRDGRFGTTKMKLMLSQNLPFVPMSTAWRSDSRSLPDMPVEEAREKALAISAKVLSNRKPPYSLIGGLYDCMKDAGGTFYEVTNDEAAHAGKLFEELEGCDIEPAAAVAVSSLMQAVEQGDVKPSDTIMINITGGGIGRLKRTKSLNYIKPSAIFDLNEDIKEIQKGLRQLFY